MKYPDGTDVKVGDTVKALAPDGPLGSGEWVIAVAGMSPVTVQQFAVAGKPATKIAWTDPAKLQLVKAAT